MSTRRLLFFRNYPSLNRICICCHWIIKPKINDVCVLFKHSNFCSRMLEIHSMHSKFSRNSRSQVAALPRVCFLRHLLQSFCHLLKILSKSLKLFAGLLANWFEVLIGGCQSAFTGLGTLVSMLYFCKLCSAVDSSFFSSSTISSSLVLDSLYSCSVGNCWVRPAIFVNEENAILFSINK